MNLTLILKRKLAWAEENAENERRLGHDANAVFWKGRALSYQDVLGMVQEGLVVTSSGIEPVTFPTNPTGEA